MIAAQIYVNGTGFKATAEELIQAGIYNRVEARKEYKEKRWYVEILPG